MMNFLFTKTPLAFFVASFWRDEAFSYLMAKLPLHSLLWSTAQDANPPLYYIVLKLWMFIFGSSEIALRSLSLLFFTATLYMAFLIMNEVYKLGTKKSLFYLLLFLANPLLHYYAFEARMYSGMAFLATLLFYLFLKRNYKFYAYVVFFSLFTHYFLLTVIAFQIGMLFIMEHKTERHKILTPLWRVMRWYLIWIVFVLFARPPLGNSFWILPFSLGDFLILPSLILTGYEKGAWVVVTFLPHLSLLIAGLTIFGSIQLFPRNKKNHLFILLGWGIGIPLVVFLVSFFKPIFLPRYLIFSAVGLTLLLILSLETITNRYLRIGLVVILLWFLTSYSSIQVTMRKKAPLKNTFRTIRNEMKENDVVYVTHEYDFHPAEYYLPQKKVYIYGKTYEELPWYVGKILIDKSAVRSSLPVYPERAFIVNNDGSYTVQSSR